MKGKFEEIINDTKPVVIDFHAIWCGPCKIQTPILKELAADLGDRIKVIKIDVDKNPEIASKYQIRSVPTVIVFKNGKPVWRQSGVAGKPELNHVLQQYI
jgi:thioredoxin 1